MLKTILCSPRRAAIAFPIIISAVYAASPLAADQLTLESAEQLALSRDPITMMFVANSQAMQAQAVANVQLPDPKLKLGAMNLPIDSFDRSEVAMTQLQVGVQQAFPRGKTLHYRGQQALAMSDRAAAQGHEQRLRIVREVRSSYADLHLQKQRRVLLLENEKIFALLVGIAERSYASGRNSQHDVMRAQLELSLIQDRLVENQGDHDTARATLARLIGNAGAAQPIPSSMPTLPTLPAEEILQLSLSRHPSVQVHDAAVKASDSVVAIAEQQYKPGWMLDVSFGERTGRDFNGQHRSDFLSAMVLIDLPLFPDKRQDRILAARQLERSASVYARDDRVYELNRQLSQSYARHRSQRQRLALYEERTIDEARLSAESALKAYQSDAADFTTLMRARLTELHTQLELLRVSVNQFKTHANLLYFVVEPS